MFATEIKYQASASSRLSWVCYFFMNRDVWQKCFLEGLSGLCNWTRNIKVTSEAKEWHLLVEMLVTGCDKIALVSRAAVIPKVTTILSILHTLKIHQSKLQTKISSSSITSEFWWWGGFRSQDLKVSELVSFSVGSHHTLHYRLSNEN